MFGISADGMSDHPRSPRPGILTNIADWANANTIAGLRFRSVTGTGCPGGGIQKAWLRHRQSDWAFTQITAGFTVGRQRLVPRG